MFHKHTRQGLGHFRARGAASPHLDFPTCSSLNLFVSVTMHDTIAPTKRTGQGPITEGDGIIEVSIDEISDYLPRPSKYTV